jgi:hypothetical protein
MRANLSRLKILLHKIRLRLQLELSSLWDYLGYQLGSSQNEAPTSKSESIRILFVCELLPARAGRMAKWLNRLPNYEVSLLCHQSGYVEEFAEDNFHSVWTYRNPWHLRSRLRKIGSVALIHAFAPKCYYPEIARAATEVPFVLDMQDVIVTYHGLEPPFAWAKKELQFEKSCLSQADLVIGQSLEPRVGFLRYGISPRPRTMFFPLYCDEDAWQPNAGKNLKEGIHLVYAGGIAGSHRDRRQFGILQFHSLIESLAAQEIHFHVYPSPSTLKPDYEEYYEIAAKNPYFHMHNPVSHHELTKELAQYHFGVLPFFREDSELKEDKMVYATSLKMYNFLEAGLPVVISRDIGYQAWVIQRGKAGKLIQKGDVPQLRSELEALDYAALLAQVNEYRSSLALSVHVPRLIQQYERLIKSS